MKIWENRWGNKVKGTLREAAGISLVLGVRLPGESTGGEKEGKMGMLEGRSVGGRTGLGVCELLLLTELTGGVMHGWRGTGEEGLGTGQLAGGGSGRSTAA